MKLKNSLDNLKCDYCKPVFVISLYICMDALRVINIVSHHYITIMANRRISNFSGAKVGFVSKSKNCFSIFVSDNSDHKEKFIDIRVTFSGW